MYLENRVRKQSVFPKTKMGHIESQQLPLSAKRLPLLGACGCNSRHWLCLPGSISWPSFHLSSVCQEGCAWA